MNSTPIKKIKAMNSNSLRASCVALCLVASCLVGIPNIYDKFLIARYIATAIGLAILFLFSLFSKKRWLVPHTQVFLPYLLITVLCCCSILWTTNTAETVYTASTVVMGFLITLVGYTLCTHDPMTFRKTLWVSAAVILVFYLLFALVQLFRIEDFSFDQLYHVIGINGHKNLLSIMLFVLSTFLLSAIPYTNHIILKILPMALFVLAMVMIILLKSRAVWLSATVALMLFGLLVLFHLKKPNFSKRVKTTTLVTAVVLAFIFLTLGLRWFAHRSVPHTAEKSEVEYNPLSTSSLVERCQLWEKTYHIADNHPLLGCGTGNWLIHFPDAGLEGLYRADVWNVNFTKPHNEYLGILSENGYIGLFLYIVFLVSLIVLSFFTLCETQSRKAFLFGALVLCVFTGCCVNALFDFPNSRIEHLLWSSIFMALLFHLITQDKPRVLGKAWNVLFLLLSLMMIIIGGFRLYGERKSFALQQAMSRNDWNTMERHSREAISPFYTVNALGLPLHWYQGKALKRMGKPQAIEAFRKAHHHSPYCKENLNDLGLEEYHTAHDLEQAEFYLKEAIRISPNYLYPYFNLAYTYLQENDSEKAKAVTDQIYMDEQKRDILINDAPFFDPYNTEATRQKIETEYEVTMQLRRLIESTP